MVKKQYFKSTGRLFTKHIIRLLSITAIFVVSIGLMSGLGVVRYNVKNYVNDVYHTCNVHDIELYDYEEGKIKELKEKIKGKEDIYNIAQLDLAYSYDMPDVGYKNEMYSYRVIAGDYTSVGNQKIDQLKVINGRLPIDSTEVLVNEKTNDIKEHQIGDELTIQIYGKTETVKVVGIVRNPTLLAKSKEPSKFYLTDNYKYIDDVIYYSKPEVLKEELATNLKIVFKDNIRNKFNSLSNEYKQEMSIAKARIADALEYTSEVDIAKIQTLEQCFSFKSLVSYADKVGIIATIFIVFFSLITLLVVFSTMTRLFDEDRGSMAVLKTLGYSNFAIALRYVAFVLIAGIVGGTLALFPTIIVNNMIIGGFLMQYNLWQISLPVINGTFFFCTGLIILLSIIITIITALKASDKKPIDLLTPKAPKVGKKILLEKIKPIWNKLSFKYKSTCRNVFLFKGRFFMTFFSIIASTTIVFASLALFDNSLNNTGTGMDLSAIKIISLVLLFFSAILCALVVYNITNINISERKREIATLMVLGYRNKEVKGYIYREIYIMSILSALVGLPTGIGFVSWVFNLMNFGELRFVNWWTYILTPILTVLFAVLATLFLNKKITKTDMNESLKVLE